MRTHNLFEVADLPISSTGLRAFADAYRNSLDDHSADPSTLEYQWQYKPHRHVYDLCARLVEAAKEIDRLQRVIAKKRAI